MTVQLSGQPFHHELDKRDPGLDYAVSNVTGADFCVHMVHGMAVDRHLPEGVPHTLLDHLWFDSVDVLLTGHYHAGFPVQRREGRYIVNPGALARINNHPSEMRRQPQVALLTFAESVQVELIALQCAAKGTDVLDRSYLEQAAYREEKLAAFVRQVRATGEFQGIDAIDIIEEIARLEGIEPDVKYEAMRRIAIVQERLGTEGDGSVEAAEASLHRKFPVARTDGDSICRWAQCADRSVGQRQKRHLARVALGVVQSAARDGLYSDRSGQMPCRSDDVRRNGNRPGTFRFRQPLHYPDPGRTGTGI